MMGKRVRFEDSETEPNHPASSRFDVTSAPCEATGNLPRPAAEGSHGPKTSEFAFFKRLKQNVGRTSCRNPLNRESISVENFGLSNQATELGKLKLKDVKFSQHASFESLAMPTKERDNERFECSSLIKTSTGNSLDSFLSATANASVNPENQHKDGDIFSSKRQKLLQRIAKTLFPEADEVPMGFSACLFFYPYSFFCVFILLQKLKDSLSGRCNLVFLLLNRLLPESSRETLNPRVRQPDTEEICRLNFDSNIQIKEDSDTSRMVVKASEDHFLDNGISASQSCGFWETLSFGETVERLDASAARNSYRMLHEDKEGNELHSSLNGIASGCWSNKVGDKNILTWGNDLYDYSTSASNIRKIFKNEAYMQLSYDPYENSQSCRFRDQNHSYEFLNRSDDSFPASKSSGLVYKDETHDFTLDREAQLCGNSRYDSFSCISLERSRPSLSSILRECTEPDYCNDFENRREHYTPLLGRDTNVDMHNSTRSSHMELEIYCPPLFTSSEDHPDSPKLEICCSSPTWSKDKWGEPEKSTWLPLAPYTYQDNISQKDLVPRSASVSYRLSCGPEKLNLDDSGLFMNTSRGSSFFFIPQMGSCFLENVVYERNCLSLEPFLISPDVESDSDLKCKTLTGTLDQRYDRGTDNILELLGPGNSSSQFLIADENNLDTLQPVVQEDS